MCIYYFESITSAIEVFTSALQKNLSYVNSSAVALSLSVNRNDLLINILIDPKTFSRLIEPINRM